MVLRCLIVDDSPHFLVAARGLLEQQGAQVVGVAGSGAEAVEQAARARPDVALVDIGLGEESGLDVAARLGDIPIILISTRDGDDVADLVAASPAIGFLPKTELSEAAIRQLLSEPRGTSKRRGPGGGHLPSPAGPAS